MKRSPIQRKQSLKSSTPLRSKTRLKPRSKKTADKYKNERVPLVKKLLAERPICEICFTRESVDLHEKLTRGRTGGVKSTEWLDPDNILCLCRICHIWVTEHPDEAEEFGWILKRST